MKFATRLNKIEEYAFSKLTKEITKVEKLSGRKVLNLGIGSPDIPPSQTYLDKIKQLYSDPKVHMYPGYGPQPQFIKALQNWYKTRHNVSLEDNEIFTINGSKDAVSHIPLAFLDANDEVLIPDPGYTGYATPVKMLDAIPITYNLTEDNNFKIDLNELQNKVSTKTRYIWLNYPSNPTGQVMTKEELVPIVNFAKKYKIWILYDNAYSEITFDNFIAPSILEVPGAKDVAIEIGSFSKSHSFAGYRIGWMAGNASAIAAIAKIKSQMDSGLSTPLQQLAAYALNHPDKKWYAHMIQQYQSRRDIIAKRLKNLNCNVHIPKASLYLWAKIPANYASSTEFSMELLHNKQVFFTPGNIFGKNGNRYIRASICADISNIDEYL